MTEINLSVEFAMLKSGEITPQKFMVTFFRKTCHYLNNAINERALDMADNPALSKEAVTGFIDGLRQTLVTAKIKLIVELKAGHGEQIKLM